MILHALVVATDAHATKSVDVTPLLVALVAALGGAGGVGWLTRRSTNRKLEAEGEKFYQEALLAARQEGREAVATVDSIRKILEERLDKAEKELQDARRRLEVMDEQLKTAKAERDLVVEQSKHERERLMLRIEELENTVAELRREIPYLGRPRPPER